MEKEDLKVYEFVDCYGETKSIYTNKIGYLEMKISYGVGGLTSEEYKEYRRLVYGEE